MSRIIRKSIPNFPKYFALEDGNILSRQRNKPKILTPQLNRGTYLYVGLRKNGKTYFVYIHHLILSTFIGRQPHLNGGKHINGDKHDNRPENLCWERDSYLWWIDDREGIINVY